jgi:putative tricarboxylic transport membrane protein
MTKHADPFWGVIASMWIGNLMLLVLNLPPAGIVERAAASTHADREAFA